MKKRTGKYSVSKVWEPLHPSAYGLYPWCTTVTPLAVQNQTKSILSTGADPEFWQLPGIPEPRCLRISYDIYQSNT